jgi:Na+-translocating ferredoxin:NAD+ oxidoreductase RNF subunit RnfB
MPADKDVERILEILPKFNCGACGYGSCEALAKKAAKDPKLIRNCVNLDECVKEKFLGTGDCGNHSCGCGHHHG